MNRKLIISTVFISFTAFAVDAQMLKISGKVVDETSQQTLPGVGIIVSNVRDTTERHLMATENNGTFAINGLKPNSRYRVKTSYLGYFEMVRIVELKGTSVDIGVLALKQKSELLQDVVIKGQAPPAVQKGDTTEMNASAFKVNRDANTQDLVQKMPGVTIENGTVKAHGEAVQRVLVDGKNYFGDDAAMALQNLPAEVVDKVQIYNKMSDQAEFTGFDDGNSQKVMNIVTRLDRRNGTSGLFTAGTDFSSKYAANARFNTSEGQRRLTLIGGSNNVNQQNFTMQDLIGAFSGGGRGGGRGGAGGGYFGRQGGINKTHSFGINYTNMLGKKVTVTGSYFFNLQDNNTDQFSQTKYNTIDTAKAFHNSSNLFSNQPSFFDSRNINHRFDLKVEYAIDSANSIIWTPRFTIQQNNRNSTDSSYNFYDPEKYISLSNSRNTIDGLGYNYSNDLLFRHKFHKKGRTISLDLAISGNLNNTDGTTWSESYGLTRGIGTFEADTVDQKSNSKTKGTTYSANLAYTEPLGANSILQFGYNTSYTQNSTDKRSYDQLKSVDNLDTLYSNVYTNNYNTQRAGVTYRVRNANKLVAAVGVDYQYADLKGDQTFPQASSASRTFGNVLPNLQLNYKFSQNLNLRVMYRTSTNPPAVNQLQNVLTINSPSLSYNQGNPDLNPQYSHNGILNFRFSSPAKSTNFSVNLFGTYTLDAIGNAVFINNTSKPIALKDVPLLLPNITSKDSLKSAGQLSMPMNFDKSMSLRFFMNYGILVKSLECNFNFIGGGGYSTSPGLLNDVSNITNQYNLVGGMVVGSNISQNIDFTVSYTANYTKSNVTYSGNSAELLNTQNASSSSNVWNHTISLRSNFTWKGIVLQNTLAEQINRGLSAGLDNSFMQWNIALAKKFLKNNNGEIKFSVFDVLNKNQNVSHTVSALSTVDTRTNTLQRYFLVTLTFNLRNYKMPEGRHGPGMGGYPGGGPPPGMGHF